MKTKLLLLVHQSSRASTVEDEPNRTLKWVRNLDFQIFKFTGF